MCPTVNNLTTNHSTMKISLAEKIAIGIVLTSFIVGVLVYPYLPMQVASHWNSAGVVNGYLPKFWGAFLFPIILLVVVGIFIAIPKIDPRAAAIQKFRRYYDLFVVTFSLFFFYLYLVTLVWNIGVHFNFISVVIPAIAVLFFVVGLMITHAEPNWTIGIRTPWTLSSETVWRKTHQLAGPLFKVAAVVSLLGLIFPQTAFWFVIVPVVAASLFSVLYSYIVYREEQMR